MDESNPVPADLISKETPRLRAMVKNRQLIGWQRELSVGLRVTIRTLEFVRAVQYLAKVPT